MPKRKVCRKAEHGMRIYFCPYKSVVKLGSPRDSKASPPFFCRTFLESNGLDGTVVHFRIFLATRCIFLLDAGVNRETVSCLGQRFSLRGHESGSSMPV